MSETAKRKKRAGRPELPDDAKRIERVELRVTLAEKRELDQLCDEGNVTLTTLLLSGVFGGIASLSHFQQLPADVAQPLTALQQIAGRLFSYAHRLDNDERTQQQVRQLVHDLSQLGESTRQQLMQTALPRHLLNQLTEVRDTLADKPDTPLSVADRQATARLIDEILTTYKRSEKR